METVFATLLILQFVVIAVHDLVDISGVQHGGQIQAVVGRRKLLAATAVNALFPAFAVICAFRFYRAPKPGFVILYWTVYTAITVASAIAMWWIPYLFGASAQHREEYRRMYAGTRHVLPERHGLRGPNLLHLAFHGLFAANLILALLVWHKS